MSSPCMRAVSPAGVLPGQPQDQLTDLVADWWSPGPLADEKAAMPSQQGARGDDPIAPQLTRQHAGQCREHRAVGPAQSWPADLTAQHRDVMAQDEDFPVLGGGTAS